jgi:hypothetical protein
MIPLMSIAMCIIKKLTMLMFNMALHFKFICKVLKLAIMAIQTIHITMISPEYAPLKFGE